MSWYYLQGILTLVGIYLLATLGLSLLTGFTGLFSFGHAGFMAIGGYTLATLMMNFQVPFLVSLVGSGLVAAIAGFLIGRLTLNLKGDYFCIATLGFGEAIRLIFDNLDYFGGARGWPGITQKITFPLVLCIDAIAVIVMFALVKSKQGRNMIAVREEELAAQTIGINTFSTKVTSLVISAFYAGVSGGMLASYLGFLQPKMFAMVKSTELTIMVIFGGLGSITGTIIGTLVLVSMPELLRQFANWRLVVYGAIVVLIVVLRPEGLMGGKEFSLTKIVHFFQGKSRKKSQGKEG